MPSIQRERKEKKEKKVRKRKRAPPPALPDQDENYSEEPTSTADHEIPAKKKRKRSEAADMDAERDGATVQRPENQADLADPDLKPTIKKSKKSKRRKLGEDTDPGKASGTGEIAGDSDAADAGNTKTGLPSTASKKNRFIVFVGNLPFSTTTPTLQSHFHAVRPSAVRHITDKDTSKSKGFAFLEFEAYDRMKTCLKLFHHSLLEGRKINVELTAGGGGKGEKRKEKLGEKNKRLGDQRRKDAKERKKEGAGKRREKTDSLGERETGGAERKGDEKGVGNTKGENNGRGEVALTNKDTQGIHPSRLARISN
ncbi:MAG: hypothetical protein M1820_006672 [Bogoriella megaspora]|nr:MAG: hypothetical protein M1820_006672 [Bogoriella megaspora]